MAWRLEGTYFESCSCDAVCPCTWSALTAKATLDRCRALLAYHVASGEIDGVDVGGLSFALFLDTPPVMSEGNWRVGVYLDDAASDSQAERLGTVLSGQAGGPPAMLGPLIGEMLGVEGVQKIVRETSLLPFNEMKKGILDGVAQWREGPPTDDVSLVLVEV